MVSAAHSLSGTFDSSRATARSTGFTAIRMTAPREAKHLVDTIISNSASHGGESIARIDYLDGWRGLAIMLVLISHFDGVPSAGMGRMGVDIFFVLSGMLMSHILFTKRTDLKTFYQRRISRIFPAFILFVVVVFSTGHFNGISSSPGEWIATLTFFRTYFPVGEGLWDSPLPIGHLWSLNVEEHSYIIMSLLALVLARRMNAGWMLIAIGFGSQCIGLLYTRVPSVAPDNFPIFTEASLAFIFYSAGYNLIKGRFRPYIFSWFPLLTLGIAAASYYSWTPREINFLAPALLAFTVNHLAEVPAVIKRALAFKPLRLMGIWSYSIYLWQQPFYEFYKSSPLLIYPVLTIAVGVMSFYWIENPARKWINNAWHPAPKPGIAASAAPGNE